MSCRSRRWQPSPESAARARLRFSIRSVPHDRHLFLLPLSSDSSGGVVLIAESAERGAQLLSRLAPLPRTGPGGEVHVLLAVRRAEAGALQDLGALKGVAITLLQEVSPAALVPGTQRALLSDSPLWQSLGEPDGAAGLDQASQDASVGALAVGVQLLGAALRAAHRIKCPTPAPPGGDGADSAPPAVFCPALHAMAPDEWKSILERVTAFSDSAATSAAAKLRFGMSLRTAARVLVKRSQSEYFEKAGLLVGGKDLQLESTRFSFPALRPGVDEDCGAAQRSPASSSSSSSSSSQGTRSTAATTSTPQRTKAVNRVTLERHPRTTPAPSSGFGADWSWILGGGADGPDGDFWTMLYMLLGAAAVMLFVFLCCFYIVYNNFRVKGNKAQDNDSISPPVSRAASRRSSGSS
ncbi:uncharacterized protein LOC127751916 isoform X2 [Frankliniella occidentalis]|uniref:Uncharacterized protein LOC127751916 isoform X2 n=1 Tax=Frankliniella occidentalis TaxID=133901 RepID=A0A9C6XVA0_FRAOC|nr:uncharacterized protein LOC127751916 isoform X2 [Frankliniella occidentalis]